MNYQVTLTYDELLHARAGLQCWITHLWKIRRDSATLESANCWNHIIRSQIAAFRALEKFTLV